ncbi:MAG: bifunctional 3,4-dihydroxy-2-butanone-4-phosphate synthase/GTP cyclohydrolase II [Chloroflexi bacterium]|nr:bifunctional 3,4-dihydroxy-2-butanone-4-phosphate synthase/GTP cyclohydrolase II [Chloroflexota bacterium]
MPLATIQEAIEDYRRGKFVIIVDDEDRENEGDLCIAAQFCDKQAITFMATYGRGLICVPMKGERLDELKIPLMVQENSSRFGTAFTVTVEAKRGVTTGISAADRATTIRTLIDPMTRPEDLARPGHVQPLRYAEGGVLRRAGQTEASIDLAILAGLYPAAVICEIMRDDGEMARLPDLEVFAATHGLKIISVAQLIRYRRQYEKLVRRIADEVQMPTRFGTFRAITYESIIDGGHHIALVKGDITTPEPVLVRVHSECLTGDVFGSLRCDCGEQWQTALKLIEEAGRGVAIYLRGQEGRGIGLHNKMQAYALQDRGLDTVEANSELGFAPDLRDYGIGAQILVDLGVREINLLTNNPRKIVGLTEGFNLRIVDRTPLLVPANPYNERYLKAKKEKLHHIM